MNKNKAEVVKTISYMSENVVYKCTKCSKKFSHNDDLTKHVENLHETEEIADSFWEISESDCEKCEDGTQCDRCIMAEVLVRNIVISLPEIPLASMVVLAHGSVHA